MSNRRQFLGTLGKALGAGGLLLPWAGKGALALSADLGKAAQLPVTAAAMPFSPECLQLRQIKHELLRVRLAPYSSNAEWRSLMVEHYKPTGRRITDRPVRTWGDCVELAEICWHFMQKEYEHGGEYTGGDYTGRLSRGPDCYSATYHCRDALAALVEGVLTLGGGERFDPNMGEGPL